jgi:short subunit dehydrogenase-like uncharacterized protein
MMRGGKDRVMLYGANGYTGRLAAALAAARGMDVVLAGRNARALAELGGRLHLPTRAVGLDDAERLSRALSDVACVVHMAGPFATTSAPMLSACLTTRTNYVDITGEIAVFEAMWARAEEIGRAGITVVPGAGFDVVPTDCLAAYVASRPDRPTALVIALRGLESASRGTLRTAISQVARPVLCRRSGAIVALDDRSPRWIDFGAGGEPCVPVSWGDVATAFRTTGVGNITVYFRRTPLFRAANALGPLFEPLLQSRVGQKGLAAIVRHFPEGPTPAQRAGHGATIWAEATDASGTRFRSVLTTPNAYDFAASCALEVASRIGALPSPLGVVTPARAFGADFVLTLPGCARRDVNEGPETP